MKCIKTESLVVGYGKKIILDQVEIQAEKGQMLCLLGPNGAGKTTLLRTLAGLLEPICGVVRVNGQLLNQKPKKELAKELAVVLTQKSTCGMMTGFEVVSLGRYPYTNRFGALSDKDLDKIAEALKAVDAENLAKRYYDELSDGEKQKILVARALVQEPEVIILDEPTTHLDIRHRMELIEILKKLSKEKNIAVILSLHEIDIALKSCDQVLLVKNGKIIGCGTPEDIVDEALIKDLYDIRGAGFNSLLGAVELSNTYLPTLFVVGGGGNGIPIYRALAKKGIGAVAGILHENDVDYEIARTMGMEIVKESAFEEINELHFQCGKRHIDMLETVIDSGTPIGKINRKNIELIIYSVSQGKKVISLRDKKEMEKYLGVYSKEICYCEDVSGLIQSISNSQEAEKSSKSTVALLAQ